MCVECCQGNWFILHGARSAGTDSPMLREIQWIALDDSPAPLHDRFLADAVAMEAQLTTASGAPCLRAAADAVNVLGNAGMQDIPRLGRSRRRSQIGQILEGPVY